MRAVALLCATMLAWRPAIALEPCFTDSVGEWSGPVLNNGRIERVDTEFSLATDGRLTGTYHIADAEPFDGALDNFTPTGPCEAVFAWHDRGGVGVVTIRFDPSHGRFRGDWGGIQPVPGNTFDGDRLAPNA